jgi:hypothetical protein
MRDYNRRSLVPRTNVFSRLPESLSDHQLLPLPPSSTRIPKGLAAVMPRGIPDWRIVLGFPITRSTDHPDDFRPAFLASCCKHRYLAKPTPGSPLRDAWVALG